MTCLFLRHVYFYDLYVNSGGDPRVRGPSQVSDKRSKEAISLGGWGKIGHWVGYYKAVLLLFHPSYSH